MSLRAICSSVKRVFATPRPIHLPCARLHTDPLAAQTIDLPPWSPACHLIKDLETRPCHSLCHATFDAVKRLAAVRPGERSSQFDPALGAAPEPPYEQQSKWMYVVEADDFWETMRRLEEAAGVAIPRLTLDSLSSVRYLQKHLSADDLSRQPPTWLVMHLLCNVAHTYDEVLITLKVVYYHIPAARVEIRSSLLLMTAIRLALLGMVPLFRRLIHCYLLPSSQVNSHDLNLMIRTVALLPNNPDAHALVAGLIRLAVARRRKLTERTYDAVLGPDMASPSVVSAVEFAFESQRTQPTTHHLERLILYSRQYSNRAQSLRYLRMLRNELHKAGASSTPFVHGAEYRGVDRRPWSKGKLPLETDAITAQNRRYTESFRSGKITRIHSTLAALNVLDFSRWAKVPLQNDLLYFASRESAGRYTEFPTFEDFTARLLVNTKTKWNRKVGEFKKVWRMGSWLWGYRFTIYHYTLGLLGCVRYGLPTLGMKILKEIQSKKLKMRTSTVGLGASLYTLNMEAHRAFALLEHVWRRRTKHPQEQGSVTEGSSVYPPLSERAGEVPSESDGFDEFLPEPETFDVIPLLYEEFDEAPPIPESGKEHPPSDELVATLPLLESEEATVPSLEDVEDVAMASSILVGFPTSKQENRRRKRRVKQLRHQRKRAVVNVQVLNQWMHTLHITGKANAVFALWDYMAVLYDVRPDSYTLNIMLQAARWSIRSDSMIRGALARLGIRRDEDNYTFIYHEDPKTYRNLVKERMRKLLDPEWRPSSTWNGQRAPRAALAIALRTLLKNYSFLKNVEHPIPQMPRNFFGNIMERFAEKVPDISLEDLAREAPLNIVYARIAPTDVTFRTIFDLLELNSLTSHTPRVVAWMHALGVKPSRWTTTTALYYWSTVENPDRWGGRQQSYNTFYLWMKERYATSMPMPSYWYHTFQRMHEFHNYDRLTLTRLNYEVTYRGLERYLTKYDSYTQKQIKIWQLYRGRKLRRRNWPWRAIYPALKHLDPSSTSNSAQH